MSLECVEMLLLHHNYSLDVVNQVEFQHDYKDEEDVSGVHEAEDLR